MTLAMRLVDMQTENQFPSPLPVPDLSTSPVQYGQYENLEKADLMYRLVEARQLLHSAAQPLTTILSMVELFTQFGVDANSDIVEIDLEDLKVVLHEAFELKNLIHEMRRKLS